MLFESRAIARLAVEQQEGPSDSRDCGQYLFTEALGTQGGRYRTWLFFGVPKRESGCIRDGARPTAPIQSVPLRHRSSERGHSRTSCHPRKNSKTSGLCLPLKLDRLGSAWPSTWHHLSTFFRYFDQTVFLERSGALLTCIT